MKNRFLLLLSIFCLSALHAQETVAIRGTVQSGGLPVPAATVSLLKRADSSLVKLAVSNKEGLFEFPGIPEGDYLIHVSSVGYSPGYVAVVRGRDAAVELVPVSEALGNVTVQARRPLVEAKIDKMVVNVDASPSNAGATALELLEKSPGISVDRDGNISLKGKQGVIVLMDGKPTYLSGQDLASLLRSLPASQLDQVEIMTQPSARFDAAGNSGVINLRTKKSRQMGMNGSLNLSYVQGNYPKSPNSFNFNYRKGKVNFFTSGGINFWQSNNRQTLLRNFHRPGEIYVFDQVGTGISTSRNYNARIGLDYTLSAKTTIGVLGSGNYNSNFNTSTSNGAFYKQGSNSVDSSVYAGSTEKRPRKNGTFNLNFRHQFNSTGQQLTADLDYIRYRSTLDQYTDNQVRYPGSPVSQYLLRGILPSDISIYGGKVDYVHPLSKEAKLEAGVKSTFIRTDNNAPYETFNDASGKWVDDVRKDHFVYEEQISAAYISFSQQVKKWGFQAGLRGEHTQTTGKQVLVNKSIPRSYFQLFPTAYLSYGMNDQNQFGLSYGRRIERPNYQDLNPFQMFLDLYTYNQGNPFLTPQFTNNIELNHVFKSRLSTTLNYTTTTDIINDILKQNDVTKVTYQTKENVASRRNLGLAISYNAPLTKWWTTSLYGNIYNNLYKGLVNQVMLKTDVTSYTFNFNQQFRFAKTWGAEMSGFFQSRSLATSMFIIDPVYVVSFGASKQVLKGKGALRLSVIDPFQLQKVDVHVNHDNIDMLVTNRFDNRRVGLTFTYRFSKGQNVQQRQRAGSAQDEQQRISQ